MSDIIFPEKDRTCKNIHDFALLLTEMCYINDEDDDRLRKFEEKIIECPEYLLANTGIHGWTVDTGVTVWFPPSKFPLPQKDYEDAQKSFSNIGLIFDNEPELVVEDCDWEYKIWAKDANRKYKEFLVKGKSLVKQPAVVQKCLREVYDGQLGYIRSNSDGMVYLDLHFNTIKKRETVEKILESIVKDGLKIQV